MEILCVSVFHTDGSSSSDHVKLVVSRARAEQIPFTQPVRNPTPQIRQPRTCLISLIFRRNRMPRKKKSSGRKYGKAAGKTVASAMRRRKRGTLKSGRGGKGGTVKSRKQAIAIGLSEARKKGAKVPREKAA